MGYLEEEAVHTYSVFLKDLDAGGNFEEWGKRACPPEAIEYYDLESNATFYDLVLNVRADEACHRELNHHFGDISTYKQVDHLHVTMQDDGDHSIEKHKPGSIEKHKPAELGTPPKEEKESDETKK